MDSESDATAGTIEATFKTQYNAILDQFNTLVGVKAVLCGIAQAGVPSDNVRQWISDIVATNVNAVGYVDMSLVYSGVHYETDIETQGVAQALFEGINAAFFTSTLNLSITGIPDGSYMTVLDKEDGTRLQRQSESYTSTNLSLPLLVPAGSRIKGYVDDGDTPSVNGAYIEGVTV